MSGRMGRPVQEAALIMNPPKKPLAPRYGPTLAPMQYLAAPGMRGLRSPSRESIASDFSVMSMSSQYAEGGMRRKRMQYLSKSRETLSSGVDHLSLNVSVDIPSNTRQPEDFLVPGQNAFVKPHQISRCFSFTDLRSVTPCAELNEGPVAVSDPSLSVNSDFDDEISMFFDDKGEPINYWDRNTVPDALPSKVAGDNDGLPPNSDVIAGDAAVGALLPGKHSKLRHRIKRKFFNFSFNELIKRRRSKKSSVVSSYECDRDERSSTGGPSPKLEKRIHINIFPEQETMKTLTDRDIEREQGKALSKYSRNLMIFNWLHNTEETWFHSQMQ